MVVLTYEHYSLHARERGGYFSVIDGETVLFDGVSQWKQYIDLVVKGECRERK